MQENEIYLKSTVVTVGEWVMVISGDPVWGDF